VKTLSLIGAEKLKGRCSTDSQPPHLIIWNFTNECNLDCLHCYQKAGQQKTDELTLEEKKEILDQIRDLGATTILFAGGEPLMSTDFFDAVEYARSRDIFVALATNGTLITRDVAKRMNDSGVSYVQVSVDGLPQTHDKLRRLKGAFSSAIKAIQNLKEYDIVLGISFTLTKFNLDELQDMIDLSKKLKLNRIMILDFVPVGKGIEWSSAELSAVEREGVLHLMFEELNKEEIAVTTTIPQFSRICLESSKEKAYRTMSSRFGIYHIQDEGEVDIKYISGCWAGVLQCTIQPDGKVTPCFLMPVEAGNLRKKKLSEIWENSRVFKKLRNRKLLKGGCGECKYKYICGGCRSRAYACYGDYLAPDPGCTLTDKQTINP